MEQEELAGKRWRKIKKGLRKAYRPIDKIERVIRPFAKYIPVVGQFAALHEAVTEPLVRRAMGLKGKPQKSKAEQLALLATSVGDVKANLSLRGVVPSAAAIAGVQKKALGQLKMLASSDAKAIPTFDFAVKATAVQALKRGSKSPLVRAVARASKERKMVTPEKFNAALAATAGVAPKAAAAPAMQRTAGAQVFVVLTPEGRKVTVPASAVRR